MLRFLCMLFMVAGLAKGDRVVINDAVDKLLEEAKIILRARGQDKIPVPNIDKTFEKTVFKTVKIKGEFHSSGGVFQDTASLHRTGDVSVNAKSNRLTLSAGMGLSDLRLDFARYDFRLLAVHSEGSIHAGCKQNALTAVVSVVHEGPKCRVELQRASIDSLGGFDVKLSGPGQLNELGSLLFTWILNQFNETIRSVINSHIEGAIRDSLKKVDLCKMLPH